MLRCNAECLAGRHGCTVVCFVIMIIMVGIPGCGTRTPEGPTGSRGTFVPPTSPMIVIDNLRNALAEKNTENYALCLADNQTRSNYQFVFEPSAEVRARYQTLFDSWSVAKERQAFVSMSARIAPGQAAELTLTSLTTSYSSPDSVVLLSDYHLFVPHNIETVPTTLRGTMVLTVTPESSGQWSISRWIDARLPTDSAENTWSLLKANLAN